MSSATVVAPERDHPFPVERLERLTYLVAGAAMIALVAAGFRHFYLHGMNAVSKPVTQQIAGLVYFHAALMTAWIVFFTVQSSLIVRGNRSLHMKLGTAGAVLYSVIVPVGGATALLSAHYHPANGNPPWGPERFLTIPLSALLGFAILVGIGLLYRRKPSVHRPLMMLGTLSAVGAGIARIPAIRQSFFQASHGSLFGTNWGPVILAAVLFGLLKLAVTRRWDRYYAIAFSILALVMTAFAYASTTGWWYQAALLVRR
jgi:uncharacterized membrane protein SirB2